VPQTPAGDHHLKNLFEGMSLDLAVPLMAATLYGYLMSSLVTLFPLYLDQTGFKAVEMGGIVTSVIAGTMLCQVPIGKAADRYGKRRVLFCCAGGLTIIFALMPSNSVWTFFLMAGPIVGALAGSLYPVGLALLAGMARENKFGAMTALFSLSFGIGSLSGPGLSGLAMNKIGIEWLFYLPAILTCSFMVMLAALSLRTARARAAGSSLP
jgi:UMF2 family putative MFS family transporter